MNLMNFKKNIFYVALVLCFAGKLWAKDTFPPRPSQFVSDYAQVLTSPQAQQLEAVITELEQKTSAEVSVVTVNSLDGADIESFAMELFKKWGIGKKDKNNGVLILVALQDREVRIEVGYGLEGILPDGKCGSIIREVMTPAFKNGDYAQGLGAGTMDRSVADRHDRGSDRRREVDAFMEVGFPGERLAAISVRRSDYERPPQG